MRKPSKNLWGVRLAHDRSTKLWVLAATAEKAATKAIRFTKNSGVTRYPRVIEVTTSGTIDVF
jgi:hypothetical protein